MMHQQITRKVAAEMAMEVSADKWELPEILPSRVPGLGTGASHLSSQQSFLKMMHIISDSSYKGVDILMDEEGSLLSCSMSHICKKETGLTDPYFTDSEWQRLCLKRMDLIEQAEALFLAPDKKKSDEWLADKQQLTMLCQCPVHQSDTSTNQLSKLIEISPPLKDNSAKRLAKELLTYIWQKANIFNVEFSEVSAGASETISYVLRLPSGLEGLCIMDIYSGYSDFSIYQSYSAAERRLKQYSLKREDRLIGIGEDESPTETSSGLTTKSCALAQAGIYTCGQFANYTENKKRSIISLIFYRDMTVHVALATLYPDEASQEDSLGKVSYQLMDSSSPYNLQNPSDVCSFAKTFIATLKSTISPPLI